MVASNDLNISEEGYVYFDGISTFTGRDALTSVEVLNATPQFVLAGSIETLDFGITNLALGSDMSNVTTGSNNTFYGVDAGKSITVGEINIGIGPGALENAIEASDNVAIGSNSMNSATVINANSNVAIGSLSLFSLVSGNDTVAIGYNAMRNVITGGSNVAVGYRAGINYAGTESFNICIGNAVNGTLGESNVTRIGSSQTKCYIDGIQGVTVSNPLFVVVNSSGVDIDQLGTSTVSPVLDVATANATPQFALVGSVETLDFALQNLALGSDMTAITSGTDNVAVGPGVLDLLTSGLRNTAMGNQAGQALTSGQTNSFFGWSAGEDLTQGSNNTLIGSSAGANVTTSADNTAVGTLALGAFTTGGGGVGSNTAIGENSLVTLSTGTQNTALGKDAGASVQTGTRNIFLGHQAGSGYSLAESHNIIIGDSIVTIGESNVIRIGQQGSGSGQQNKAFIAGITSTTVVGPATNIDSNGQIGSLAALTNGQMYIGSTGASPAAGTITGTAIAVSVGAGTLSLGVTGGGLTWNNVTGATQTVFSRNGYIANRGTLVTFTMNGTNIGDVARIVGKGAGGWTLLPTGSQIFYFGNTASTVTTGSLSSTNSGDCVELVALSSTEIIVMSSIGNITVV